MIASATSVDRPRRFTADAIGPATRRTAVVDLAS
jgi:hypothetical protein